MARKITGQMTYEYKNAPIPGGGYINGILYHPTVPDVLYIRTDIGGTYRFDAREERWIPLSNHATMLQQEETAPVALALDAKYPRRIHMMCGALDGKYGLLCTSNDYGEHFDKFKVPVYVKGNQPGRGTGNKLVVDPTDSEVLYYASQRDGLLRTMDGGETWGVLPVPERECVFVWVSDDGKTVVCSTTGMGNLTEEAHRGPSLYVSYDSGESFEPMEMPKLLVAQDSTIVGYVGSRYAFDGKYLYVTFNMSGKHCLDANAGYCCDSGDAVSGRIVKYPYENGRFGTIEEITPPYEAGEVATPSVAFEYGFGGIDICRKKPGMVVCASVCTKRELGQEDTIYISMDYGKTWEISLRGLEQGDIYFNTSYMDPMYNGNCSWIHWMSDIAINPFNENELWVNTGLGIFRTIALLSKHPAYHDFCDGIEQTIHLNVYSLMSGDVQVVDLVGDLGGFAFRHLAKECRNSFADSENNRYVTCINADLSDEDCNMAIISTRGNWSGKTKGGLIMTKDGYRTFERLPMTYGLAPHIDARMREIELPNHNPGWVAMSPDGQNIVWTLGKDNRLPIDGVITSSDGGKTFVRAGIYDLGGNVVEVGDFKPFSDRMNPDLFYGFGDHFQIYISNNGGKEFFEVRPSVVSREYMEISLPMCDFGLVDIGDPVCVRGESGTTGVFYLALGFYGMWKFSYNPKNGQVQLQKLTDDRDWVFRLGLGLGRPEGDFASEDKAIYLCGVIDGKYGFFRTLDYGQSFQRLSNERQNFGRIGSVEGDKRVFGRFFVGSGTRGLLYGSPISH